ncbi:MAG: hypothetical protein GY703_00120 [Gammaproteobacteria bacterium]|nr:hypothetical protein [Gammaproteobacteria bacterium]
MLTLDWRKAYDLDDLPAAETLELLNLSEEDLAPRWRCSSAASDLETGHLPGIRVPGGSPLILRTGSPQDSPAADDWSAKAWLPSRQDLHPRKAPMQRWRAI